MLEQFGHAPVRMGSCGLSLRECLSESAEDSCIGLGFLFEKSALAGDWVWHQRGNFFDASDVIANASLHCRCYSQCPMNRGKVKVP